MPSVNELRAYRNTRLYRLLTRTLRVYNRRMLVSLHARGFADMSPGFFPILSNLDTEGTRIGVLAMRGGVTRQAAGQLLKAIEQAGYVELRTSADDARVTMVHFSARGRKLLAAVFEAVDEIESDFAAVLKKGEFGKMKAGLLRIADAVDPEGSFGSSDE
jgi:DNA-binding MarR family transcriptional regulator